VAALLAARGLERGGRAIARGSVFTRDGALVASVVQEGLSQIAPGDSALGGR
jgi:acyl-CoA thioesterase